MLITSGGRSIIFPSNCPINSLYAESTWSGSRVFPSASWVEIINCLTACNLVSLFLLDRFVHAAFRRVTFLDICSGGRSFPSLPIVRNFIEAVILMFGFRFSIMGQFCFSESTIGPNFSRSCGKVMSIPRPLIISSGRLAIFSVAVVSSFIFFWKSIGSPFSVVLIAYSITFSVTPASVALSTAEVIPCVPPGAVKAFS